MVHVLLADVGTELQIMLAQRPRNVSRILEDGVVIFEIRIGVSIAGVTVEVELRESASCRQRAKVCSGKSQTIRACLHIVLDRNEELVGTRETPRPIDEKVRLHKIGGTNCGCIGVAVLAGRIGASKLLSEDGNLGTVIGICAVPAN